MSRRSISLTRLSTVALTFGALTLSISCGEESAFAPDSRVAVPPGPSPLAVSSDNAQAIRILSGQLIFDRATSERSIELKGTQGVKLSGGFLSAVVLSPVDECQPCVPGDVMTLNAYISDGDFPGTTTFHGKTYRLGGGGNFDASATLHITGAEVTLPPITPGATATLSAPFELIANGLGHSTLRIPGEPPRSLTGAGIATLQFRSQQAAPGEYVWLIMRALYDFGH